MLTYAVVKKSNYSRLTSGFFANEQDLKDLVLSIHANGFLVEQGSIGICKITDSELQSWQEQKTEWLDNLRQCTTAEDKDKIFRYFGLNVKLPLRWKTDEKTEAGKQIFLEISPELIMKSIETLPDNPEYSCYCGFRRSAAIILANALRLHTMGEPIDPVTTIKVFKDEYDRRHATIVENTGKKQGILEMSWPDMFRQSYIYFTRGDGTMIDKGIEKGGLFARGTGQKLRAMCELFTLCQESNLLNRVALAKDSPEFVNPSKYDKESMRKLAESVKSGEKPASTIVDYFATQPAKVDRIMAKPAIQAILAGNPVKIIQDVCRAILEDNKKLLDKYSTFSRGINYNVDATFEGMIAAPTAKEAKALYQEYYPNGHQELLEQLKNIK